MAKTNRSKKSARRGRGKPPLYRPKFCQVVAALCANGATDQEVADALDISARTLYRWRAQYPEFCQAMQAAKEVADERVERSLYARAVGYEHDEVDVRAVRGKIKLTPIRRHYPPDTAAAHLWLRNRRPKRWAQADGSPPTGAVLLVFNPDQDPQRLEEARQDYLQAQRCEPQAAISLDQADLDA